MQGCYEEAENTLQSALAMAFDGLNYEAGCHESQHNCDQHATPPYSRVYHWIYYFRSKNDNMGYLPERLLAHIMEESLREQHITTFHQDLKFSAQ
mmetsp:Transcript_41590/g.35009  ORF Transcript_41590/g.35009 Transcript_41590/m.35009 type:complete len:95 (-) Transcript_41590:214-498(-)